MQIHLVSQFIISVSAKSNKTKNPVKINLLRSSNSTLKFEINILVQNAAMM